MENDLISRSKLKEDLLNRSFYPSIVKNALENAPAVDAVEVVRCKDCKNMHEDTMFGQLWCGRLTGTYQVRHDDFCSYGERRSDDG